MSDPNESARATFRKLAVFEIDAKKFLADRPDLDHTRQLLAAADLIDELFWRQASPETNYQSMLDQMGDDEELKEMYLFNRGPYDRFNNNEPFLPVEPEFSGVGFYPRGLTREEFTRQIRKHLELKPAFESPYTLIRRVNNHLTAVPYHVAYRDLLEQLSALLSQASHNETHSGFREFLAQRAKDLLVDEYYPSESLWVSLEDNPIDLVIGPYEVYEDGLMGLKTAYEAMIMERDFEESAKISHIQRELSALCDRVEPNLGRQLNVQSTRIKLSVANLVYAGGEARKAVPAIAFSLPNDEQVIEEVGSRQVILKNVIEAKFGLVTQKVTNRVLEEPLEDDEAAFRHFFTHTLFHEISHSLGPQRIVINGEATTVNRCLRQYHSVLEEVKADVVGACLALNADDNLDSALFLKGFVGRFIRAIRFGIDQAHGGANAIQFNYLLQEKGFTVDQQTGMISVNEAQARVAVFKLAAQVIQIQECGDFEASQRFVNQFCLITPQIQLVADRVSDLPIDIRIRYREWRD